MYLCVYIYMYVDSRSDIICNEYEFTYGFLNVYVCVYV